MPERRRTGRGFRRSGRCVRSTPRDELARQLGIGAADVAQMLPELNAMYPELSRPENSDAEAARFQLFDSTATFMRNAAAAQPTLIVLDDLHAADTPSILLLRFVATQLSEMAVLIVGTYRDLELTPDHPLTLAIAEMARERATRLMMLGGLDSDAVERLHTLDRRHRSRWPDGRRCVARDERQPAVRRRGRSTAGGRGPTRRRR